MIECCVLLFVDVHMSGFRNGHYITKQKKIQQRTALKFFDRYRQKGP
jgi:hypothetical protein